MTCYVSLRSSHRYEADELQSCGGIGHMSRDCQSGGGRSQKCFNCGEHGHLSRDCPMEQSTERICYSCRQPGHISSACPNA